MNENFKLDEEFILDFWKKNEIYIKVQEKNKGLKPFVHIDGPPYPTGEIHVGHLRNWAIKDAVLRFKRLQGFDVYAKDGYDVHGLPVEQKVQSKLGFKEVDDLRKFGEENFVKECKKYVKDVIDSMTERRERYGLSMSRDFYHTSHPDYLSFAWKFFKVAHEKGLLYKDFKCVAWSPALETTLSDYEIKDSYAELEDPSVYVRFKLREKYQTTNYDEFLLIWTTTPWTLEANQAIAVHKDFDYVKVLIKDDEGEYVLIVAEVLVEQVISKLSKTQKIESHNILERVKGFDLIGIHYDHPYFDTNKTQKELALDENNHRVMHADFVTLGEGESHFEKLEKKSYKHDGPKDEKVDIKGKQKKLSEGTGLAHEAPAHGMEDFELCRTEGINYCYCVVDSKGLMISESLWAGENFRDANKKIMEYLLDKKIILHGEWKKHTYPLCWRSKVPILYRTTEQWYIKRSEIIPGIIEANKNVKWFPDYAKENFNNLMEGAGDWAISRQRFWGIPLPIFEDSDGNFEVIGSKDELQERTGKSFEDIHRDDLKGVEIILKNGNKAKHVQYIADVWFDSGCASFASHYGEGLSFDQILKKYYPMSWITEGRDQIRGWFSSLFNVGYLLTNKAPYNQVLFQEFVMAKDGSKMSKSLGNGVEGVEALELWGADRTRYYFLSKALPEGQINFDREEITTNVEGFFNVVENLAKFMNSYFGEYEVSLGSFEYKNLDVEDLWILSRLNNTIFNYVKYCESYKLNLAFLELENFIVKDLSKMYLKIVKERTESRDDILILIFKKVLKEILILLSPAVPFMTEKIYQNSNLNFKKESIFLESLPTYDSLLEKEVDKLGIDSNFEITQDIIAAILNSREKAKIGVRWPLSQIDIISTRSLKEELKPFEKLIKKLTNILKINYDLGDVEMNYLIKPNFVSIKQDFKDPSIVIKAINMNKFYISNDIKDGHTGGTYEGVKLDFDKHVIKEVELKGELTSSDFKRGNVILHTHQDEILLEEGYLREIIRRVQLTRKEVGLNKSDWINLSFHGSDLDLIDIIINAESQICKKVQAREILKNKFESENKKLYEIKGKKLVVSIEK